MAMYETSLSDYFTASVSSSTSINLGKSARVEAPFSQMTERVREDGRITKVDVTRAAGRYSVVAFGQIANEATASRV